MTTMRVPEDVKRTEMVGRGRHRQKVAILVCPQCHKEMHLVVRWTGPWPSFGVVCMHCPETT